MRRKFRRFKDDYEEDLWREITGRAI